jgi:hypothetical protein
MVGPGLEADGESELSSDRVEMSANSEGAVGTAPAGVGACVLHACIRVAAASGTVGVGQRRRVLRRVGGVESLALSNEEMDDESERRRLREGLLVPSLESSLTDLAPSMVGGGPCRACGMRSRTRSEAAGTGSERGSGEQSALHSSSD